MLLEPFYTVWVKTGAPLMVNFKALLAVLQMSNLWIKFWKLLSKIVNRGVDIIFSPKTYKKVPIQKKPFKVNGYSIKWINTFR